MGKHKNRKKKHKKHKKKHKKKHRRSDRSEEKEESPSSRRIKKEDDGFWGGSKPYDDKVCSEREEKKRGDYYEVCDDFRERGKRSRDENDWRGSYKRNAGDEMVRGKDER